MVIYIGMQKMSNGEIYGTTKGEFRIDLEKKTNFQKDCGDKKNIVFYKLIIVYSFFHLKTNSKIKLNII